MPAWRIALDYEHVQPFGSTVNSRCQAAGSRADHDQVVHFALVDSGVQPEAFSRFGVAGVAQNQRAAADHDRNFGDLNVELIENGLNVRIALYIQIGVRMAVAGQKLAQAQGVAGMVGSDQDRIAKLVADEIRAAQQESTQENLAERGIGLENTTQIRSSDFQERTRLDGPAADQSAASGEQINLTSEGPALENPELRVGMVSKQ